MPQMSAGPPQGQHFDSSGHPNTRNLPDVRL